MQCNQKLTGLRVAITTCWMLLRADVNSFTALCPLHLQPQVNAHCCKQPRSKEKKGLHTDTCFITYHLLDKGGNSMLCVISV